MTVETSILAGGAREQTLKVGEKDEVNASLA